MTSSGARAVQIAYPSHHGSRQIEHIGSANNDAEMELLKAVARQRLRQAIDAFNGRSK